MAPKNQNSKNVQVTAESKTDVTKPVDVQVAAPVADASVAQKAGSKKASTKKAVAPKKAVASKKDVDTTAPKQDGGDAAATPAEGDEAVTVNGKRQRYFKCVYNNDSFGRYCGLKPKQAANKALTSIIRSNGGNDACIDKPFKFEMIECTRGGTKKRSLYEGIRTKLQVPLVVTIKSENGNKVITYNFTNKLKKVKDAETVKQAGGKKVAGKKAGKKPAAKKQAKTAPVADAKVDDGKSADAKVDDVKPVDAKAVDVAKPAADAKPAKKAASKKAPAKKSDVVKA